MTVDPHHAEDAARRIAKQEKLTFVAGVGAGAFKHTFHVTDEAGQAFALKVYKSASLDVRTEREIKAMRRCDHPNIARVISLGQLTEGGESFVYSVEEFLAGGSLGQRLKAGVLSPEAIREIGGQLIDALAHLHSLDLVHRDLKPDNIMFRDDGNSAVIVDFGLVRDLQATSVTASWMLQGPGTPYFAAPEQLNNEKQMIDWRADQFGLGVTLAIALMNEHPFAHPGDTAHATVMRVIERKPVAPEFEARCKKDGYNALLKMVRPWPVRRFRLPDELLAAWNEETH